MMFPSLARRPLGSAVVGPANSFDRSHGDARFGRDLSILPFQDRKRDRIIVVNASERKLWYLAIGSLRTILVEHVEPDEFGARSRFLAHVSIFLPTLVSWQAAQKLSNLRFQFDRSSTAVIFRKNSLGPAPRFVPPATNRGCL
jgi:hypothetical protein